MSKVEPLPYDDRTVYSVSAFNRGVAQYLRNLPTVWVEGEVTELRRHERWASVFFSLKDPTDGSSLGVTMPRGQFDGLRLELIDGERVHVFGRPELYEQRGDLRLRALSIERFGVGAHLAALERLKTSLAAEGLFAAARKRALPLLPRRIGLVTGNDAAAKRDVITTIQARFPAADVLVAETYVQGPRAALGIVAALDALCEQHRPWQASSSSRSWLNCRERSTGHASRSHAARDERSSATLSGWNARRSGSAPRPDVRSRRRASSSSGRTSGCDAHRH